MANLRPLFINHVAQTSMFPLHIEVDRASGMYILDTSGKRYLDLNSGISVSSLGHCHPAVKKAIKDQTDQYLHTMVYGEHIQSPQVRYARLLTSLLADSLDSVYYSMSGSEAVEVGLKIARKYTGRHEIVAGRMAYHGSTSGSESLRSDTEFLMKYAPLVPSINHITFNDASDLSIITDSTAAVIIEPVQAESGVVEPTNNYLSTLRKRCNEVGCLLILDEIQTGFGRTGSMFAHQKYSVVPDVLLLGKAMGGGMPISAAVSSREIMQTISTNPGLGHLTTFGGHPVCCAAALACLEVLQSEEYISSVARKEQQFRSMLHHDIIKEVRSSGLMMAVEVTRRKYLRHVVDHIIEKGALVDYFLFNDRSFRLAPPLIITNDEIKEACHIILNAMDVAQKRYA